MAPKVRAGHWATGGGVSEPDKAAVTDWQPRTDAGARKLIDRVDAIASKLDARIRATDEDVSELRKALNRRLKHKVGWLGIISLLLTVGGAVIAFVVNAAGRNADDVRQVRSETAAQVLQVRTETAERLNRFEAKQDALLQVIVEGESRVAAQRELARRTGEETNGR